MMNIPKDKMMHLAMGVGAVVATLAALELAKYSPGAACAFITTLFGVFYEAQQWWRKEGNVEVMDAVATALPGWLFWLILEVR